MESNKPRGIYIDLALYKLTGDLKQTIVLQELLYQQHHSDDGVVSGGRKSVSAGLPIEMSESTVGRLIKELATEGIVTTVSKGSYRVDEDALIQTVQNDQISVQNEQENGGTVQNEQNPRARGDNYITAIISQYRVTSPEKLTTESPSPDTMGSSLRSEHERDEEVNSEGDNTDSDKPEKKKKKTEQKKKKKSGKKIYDWTHYDWGEEVWSEIRESGETPERETWNTILVGAYLLGLKLAQDIEVSMIGSDYGKLIGQAQNCIDYFIHHADDKEIEGLNDALDYISWFVSREPDSFIAKTGFSTDMLFKTATIRKYQANQKLDHKRGGYLSRNNQGRIIRDDEERKNFKAKRV